MDFKNKKIYLAGSAIILIVLFLISASPIQAASCGDSQEVSYLSSYFDSLFSFSEKIIKNFGFQVTLAAAPDPDFCGSDSVSCSGTTPTAAISWTAAPSSYRTTTYIWTGFGNMPITFSYTFDHYILTVSPAISGSPFNTGATNSFDISSGLANNTTYSWSVEAYYSIFSINLSSASLGFANQPYGSFTTPNCVPVTYTLTVLSPTGGKVIGSAASPVSVNCGPNQNCTYYYSAGTAMDLTATPEAGYTFTGWSGDCSGTGACTVTMDAAKSVTAAFAAKNQAPSASNLSVSQPNYCKSGPAATFSWTFSDPDAGNTQSAYQVQVATYPGFSGRWGRGITVVDSCIPAPGTCASGNTSDTYATTQGILVYNQKYYWRVRVWDNYGLVSAWASGSNFTTPKHVYPTVNFKASPLSPSVNETVQFTDLTTGGAAIISWNWSIPDATYQDGANANSQNPKVKFTATGTKTITLVAKDADNYQCSNADTAGSLQSVKIKLPLPGWKEVAP